MQNGKYSVTCYKCGRTFTVKNIGIYFLLCRLCRKNLDIKKLVREGRIIDENGQVVRW